MAQRITWRTDVLASLSLLLSLVLVQLPLPDAVAAWRPAFPLIITGYWMLKVPSHYGLLIAWVMGLGLDFIYDGLIGGHALAMVAASYLLLKMIRSFSFSPLWQQMLMWFPVVLVYEFMLFWMDGIVGQATDPWYRWLPVLSTPLFWPLLVGIFSLLMSRRRSESSL